MSQGLPNIHWNEESISVIMAAEEFLEMGNILKIRLWTTKCAFQIIDLFYHMSPLPKNDINNIITGYTSYTATRLFLILETE